MVDIFKLLRQAYQAYRRRKNWQRFVRTLAMIVVFCTTYALILPAITLERAPECGLSEHIHTEQCYDSTVEIDSGHTHTDTCYTSILICDQEETQEHFHTEDCYQAELCCTLDEDVVEAKHPLICDLVEHAHTEECYPEVDPAATEGSADPDELIPEEQFYDGISDDLTV